MTQARVPLAVPARRDAASAYYVVFFAAGMPALIYQVAWQRILTLYFGVDIYSTSITVATFMLGLGVGSLIGGWLADRVKGPALAYAAVEAAMGVIGFGSVAVFSAVGQGLAGASLATVIGVDFALLLVPTTLMGMTLPLMCRIVVGQDASIGRHLSWLYGVNTLGAAAGALLSSYLLIGLLGVDGATYLAATLNVLLAVIVYGLSTGRLGQVRAGLEPPSPSEAPLSAPGPTVTLGYRSVLTLSFLSGFIALGYELVWYRVLGLILHSTVYVFGTILFVFLIGIAGGSLLARSRIDTGRCVERFAWCQLWIAGYSLVLFSVIGYFSTLAPMRQLLGASFFTSFHPAPELFSGNVDVYSLYSLFDIGLWSIVLLGPPTFLMGYGFTNLMREAAQRVETLGHTIGAVYCSNIAGSTLGSLAVGFVFMHYLGTEHTLRILIVLGCAMPLLLFSLATRDDSQGPMDWRTRRPLVVAIVLATAAIALFPGRTTVVRALHFAGDPAVEFIAAEDRTGVSALRRQTTVLAFGQEASILGQQRLYIDGAHHGDGADTSSTDASLSLALAAHPAPRRILSIGLGDGQMAGAAMDHADVQELVIVELSGTLRSVLSQTVQGERVLSSPKTRFVVDDGRRWLLANPDESFDVIMMFPLHAAHAHSGSLFSAEFLTLLSRHLRDGGVVILRTVDLYSTARTLATVFPEVIRVDAAVYVAGEKPIRLDRRRLPGPIDESLKRITADRTTILEHTAGARLNTDLRPNSEFYITYPYVRYLRTRFANDVYRASDDRWPWGLLSPAEGTE